MGQACDVCWGEMREKHSPAIAWAMLLEVDPFVTLKLCALHAEKVRKGEDVVVGEKGVVKQYHSNILVGRIEKIMGAAFWRSLPPETHQQILNLLEGI